MSRTFKSFRNIGVSVSSQILVIALGFITRSVFLQHLGVELLGISTLLTSLVALLALADLGMSSALMYALYEPLRNNNIDKVSSIVRYSGRLFNIVATVVTIFGLALIPFLDNFITLKNDDTFLELYYLVFLSNTVLTYTMLNRSILLNADQKVYITKIYYLIFNIIRSILQIFALIAYESFLGYILIQAVCTIVNNLTVYLHVGRMYPYIRQNRIPLGEADRRSILESVRSMVIFRIGGLLLSNSTPIMISLIVGTVSLGYYSNYMLIIAAAVMLSETVFTALTPSVGNLVASLNGKSVRAVFDELVLMSILLHGLASVGLFAFIDDFIAIWVGDEFILEEAIKIGIIINFYISGVMMPMWAFRTATGLFRRTQWLMIMTAVLSVVLAFILGRLFGLAGIVIAPAVARLLTGGWYEPWLLFKDYLAGKAKGYFITQTLLSLFWGSLTFLIYLIDIHFFPGELLGVIIKIILVIFLFPLLTWLLLCKNATFHALYSRVLRLVRLKR